MVVCRLSVGSAEDIAAIELECNRPPWPVELIKSEFDHSYSRIYGIRNGGKLVGFLCAHQVLDEIHILNFGILKTERKKGLGRQLLVSVLTNAYEDGVKWATLEVRVSNEVAINLYKSLGFYEAGIREKYYTDDKENGYVFRCDISSIAQKTLHS